MRCLLIAVFLLFLPASTMRGGGQQVYVIAESVSTGEAQRILYRQRWTEVPLRRAQFVLVVVRSELDMPLTGFYSSVAELKHDAETQLNIAGSNYVVYVFALDDDLRPTEVRRIAYPGND
jgi:cell division GTPase FtsZ